MRSTDAPASAADASRATQAPAEQGIRAIAKGRGQQKSYDVTVQAACALVSATHQAGPILAASPPEVLPAVLTMRRLGLGLERRKMRQRG